MKKTSNFLKQARMEMAYQIIGNNIQLLFVVKSSSYMYVNFDTFKKKIDGWARIVDTWVQYVSKVGKKHLGKFFGNARFGYEDILIAPDTLTVTVLVAIGDPNTFHAQEFLKELESKGFKKN